MRNVSIDTGIVRSMSHSLNYGIGPFRFCQMSGLVSHLSVCQTISKPSQIPLKPTVLITSEISYQLPLGLSENPPIGGEKI